MKIFGIGLGRTGTTSLAKALRILGYSCIDYPHDDAAIEAHESATDETVACQFKELAEKYPDSKFIYTFRSTVDWLTSYARCFSIIPEGAETHPVIARTYMKLYGQVAFDKSVWLSGGAKHADSVGSYFVGPDLPRLLTMDITAGDGWTRLCNFLEKPVPRESFPCLNQGPPSQS